MKLTSLRSKKNQKGAALVEMALILPVLLLLVFGIIEFGWMLRSYQAVGQCAREGVRTAALGGTTADVNERIDSTAEDIYNLTPGNFSSRQIQYRTFTKVGTDWTPGSWQTLGDPAEVPTDTTHYSQMRVTLTYDYSFITGFIDALFGDGLQLQQGIVMRKEGYIGGS